jgi:hypothetical protein
MYEPRCVVPACAFEDPADVLLQALLGPVPHGVSLSALDKVDVITQDAEPEGEIRVGDLVERIGRGVAQRDDALNIAGSPQPLQRIVDALLGAAGYARPAARRSR